MKVWLAMAALGLLQTHAAMAADLSCHLSTVQVYCEDNKCAAEPEGEATPMALNRNGGTLSICAGESCWEGAIALRRSRGGYEFLYADVRRTEPRGAPEPLAVIYEPKTRTAVIRWNGYATPMACGPVE
jgi:hypothetical protein